MEAQPLIIEQLLHASVEKVWTAITDKDVMKQWYFDIKGFRAEEGASFSFYGGDENKQYLHLCKVTEVVPHKKLTYSWQYDNVPGISYVTFELFDEDSETKVRLTHSGVESFDIDDSNFKRESFEKGWTYIIKTSLKTFIDKP
ncbi:MAG: SRPBCC domain-containing protein [Ginsengibacter sp.]